MIGTRGVDDHAVVGRPEIGAGRENDANDESAFGQSFIRGELKFVQELGIRAQPG